MLQLLLSVLNTPILKAQLKFIATSLHIEMVAYSHSVYKIDMITWGAILEEDLLVVIS